MLEFLFTVLLLAVDIGLLLTAIWLLLKASLLIAIGALILCLLGVQAWWVVLIAACFTVGKWLWARKS